MIFVGAGTSGSLGVVEAAEMPPTFGTDPTLGDNLCEVGIQFDDDFIEWSVSFAEQGFPPPCDVAKQLAAQSIRNIK